MSPTNLGGHNFLIFIDWRDFKSKNVDFEDKFKGILQFLSHPTIFKNLKSEN